MRRKGKSMVSGFQDPGKDIFAFLFLTSFIMIFVMLVAYEQKVKGGDKSPGPPIPENGGGTIILPKGDVGELMKENDKIFLVFGNSKFDPTDEKQLNTLIAGPWIKEKDGKKVMYLNLKEASNSRVLLNEYFSAFNEISRRNIEVVFGR